VKENPKVAREKRKAWDDDGDEKIESKKGRTGPTRQENGKEDKAQTSVAAVIQLGKRKSDAKPNSSIWGQIGGKADSNFGSGAAWD
jgi:hypothetical protein